MEIRKIPMRTCIACRTEKPKKELIRIVKTKDGVFSLDRTGKVSGRGAYLCDSQTCASKIINKKLLARAFETESPLEVYESLRREFFGKE